ncbi:MAG: AarF/ABC1/UbiB kinase family protein [Cyanobacteria bacterium P01_E01_bin.42]
MPQTIAPPQRQHSPSPQEKNAITIDAEAVKNPEDLSSTEIGHYDPDFIMDYYQKRPFSVFGRIFTILRCFLGFIFGLWWDKLWNNVAGNEKKRAVQLREILTRLGPTYIKVGQALSTRPDLISAVYMDELARLQDQLPPFTNELAYQFIEEELGDRPEDIYAELSPQPVAAASLGQVYKGKLKTGETVAVKVQRPDLIESISLDVYIMRRLAIWAQNNIKRLRSDVVGIADEFAGRIFEEMDYELEGRNAELFSELYDYLEEIYVPRIYWDYTGRRVLTMEWIEGTKLTNLEEVQARGIDATHLVEVGVGCSLRQLLEHGFFHADPHPGNLLATRDGKLAYLDFGMMSRIKPYQRYGLIEAVVHLVNRDFESLAEDYVKLDFLTEDTDLQPIIPALTNVFGNALGASVAELNFKSITDQMSEMMYEFPFRVPAYYALIIRSLVTLEGIAIGIDPDFKVLSKAYPYIAKRLLTDPSTELRSSLRDLLFKDGSFRWNRLENLLRNARDSQDYDFEFAVSQALDFIFSERGEFIRLRLVDEIVQAIDIFGRKTLFDFSTTVRQKIGMSSLDMPAELQETSPGNLDRIQNIWQIIQETRGFDPFAFLSVVPKVLSKSETQEMGQQIANGLVQKVAARLIRNILLEIDRDFNDSPQWNGVKSLPSAS